MQLQRRLILNQNSVAMNTTNNENRSHEFVDQIVKGFKLGISLQTRFTFIPRRGLSRETVGGIWDATLGKKGHAIIRFDKGLKSGQPHINVDPKGFPGKNNPHIPVPEGVVKGAEALNTGLQYAGPVLLGLAVAADTYRLGCAVKNDYDSVQNADKTLEDLDEVLTKLYQIQGKSDAELDELFSLLHETTNSQNEDEPSNDDLEALNALRELRDFQKKTNNEFLLSSREILNQLVENLENIKKEIQLIKVKVPCKTIKAVTSISGGWFGGAAGATGGVWAGTQTGATIGTFIAGPAGTAVGGFIGAVAGGIVGGIGGGIGGGTVGEKAANAALDYTYDLKFRRDGFAANGGDDHDHGENSNPDEEIFGGIQDKIENTLIEKMSNLPLDFAYDGTTNWGDGDTDDDDENFEDAESELFKNENAECLTGAAC